MLVAVVLCLPAAGQGRRRADARVSANLDAIARRMESRVPAVAPMRIVHEPVRPGRTRTAAAPRNQLRALAITQPAAASSPVSYSGFPALLDNFTVIPPDANGAVSAQYVMTALNTQVSIQSRTGAVRPNYPITLNAFWSALGSFSDTFDPRVQYDAAADRWIMVSAANGDSPSSALLLGVSQTGDPGGNWNLFRIDTGGQTWGDYPVLGFNGKWVVVSLNLFRVGGGNGYRGTTLYVFNKDELFQRGNDSFITFTDNQGELIPARDFDNRPDTMYFVQAYTDRGLGTIRLSKLTGATGSESFRGGNGGQIVFGDPWDDAGADDSDFAPQAGTLTKVDTGDDRVQNCVMRRGRIWCTHTVFLPYQAPTRSAVQWFEIDTASGTIAQRGRIDDPSNTYFYAYPSIAVNKNNEALLGFTRFGANEYPSAHFAFRTAQDPAGAFQPDVIFKRGEAPYIGPGVNSGHNRWGDYSGTLVDPVDDLSFWTIQPYASTPPQGRRGLFGTWWAKVTAPSAGLNCNYTLSAATQMIASQAGTGTVSVATDAACPWMAASNVPWITINSGSPATGGGTVRFSVTQNPNTNSQRVGTVTIAGQTFNVTQAAPPVNVDLTVSSMSAPTTTQAGQMATVTAVVINQSSEVAGAFRVGFYLGAGPSVAAGDALLGSCAAAGLAPSGSFTCNKSVGLPMNIQPGQYVIGAIADDEIQLADTNRANNTRTSDFGAVTISNPVRAGNTN